MLASQDDDILYKTCQAKYLIFIDYITFKYLNTLYIYIKLIYNFLIDVDIH